MKYGKRGVKCTNWTSHKPVDREQNYILCEYRKIQKGICRILISRVLFFFSVTNVSKWNTLMDNRAWVGCREFGHDFRSEQVEACSYNRSILIQITIKQVRKKSHPRPLFVGPQLKSFIVKSPLTRTITIV